MLQWEAVGRKRGIDVILPGLSRIVSLLLLKNCSRGGRGVLVEGRSCRCLVVGAVSVRSLVLAGQLLKLDVGDTDNLASGGVEQTLLAGEDLLRRGPNGLVGLPARHLRVGRGVLVRASEGKELWVD